MSLKTIHQKIKWSDSFPFLISFILFYLSLYLFLSQTSSDILLHIDIAKSISNGHLTVVHIFFHILTIFISKIASLHIEITMITLLSLLVVIQFTILSKYFANELPEKYNKYTPYSLLALIIMFSAPMHIPQIHGSLMYLGKISNSIWHNPTIICLKPIALLTFFTFLKFLKEPSRKKYQILFNILLLLSIWVKPNFAIYFMPASFIILMASSDLQWKSKISFAVRLYLLSTASLLLQSYIYQSIDQGGNEIIIDFGAVWSVYAESIFINILCSFAFPISVIIFNKQYLKRKDLQLSILGVIISMLQFYCFAESGSRLYDGNWIWGLQTASIFFWMITLVIYMKEIKSHKLFTNLFLSAILMSHICFGIIYFLRIFNDGSYM